MLHIRIPSLDSQPTNCRPSIAHSKRNPLLRPLRHLPPPPPPRTHTQIVTLPPNSSSPSIPYLPPFAAKLSQKFSNLQNSKLISKVRKVRNSQIPLSSTQVSTRHHLGVAVVLEKGTSNMVPKPSPNNHESRTTQIRMKNQTPSNSPPPVTQVPPQYRPVITGVTPKHSPGITSVTEKGYRKLTRKSRIATDHPLMGRSVTTVPPR